MWKCFKDCSKSCTDILSLLELCRRISLSLSSMVVYPQSCIGNGTITPGVRIQVRLKMRNKSKRGLKRWAAGAPINVLMLQRECSRLFTLCWTFTGWWSLPEALGLVTHLDFFLTFTLFTLFSLKLCCNNSS